MDPVILFVSQKVPRKYAEYAGQHFWIVGQAAGQLHAMLLSRLQSAGQQLADDTHPGVIKLCAKPDLLSSYNVGLHRCLTLQLILRVTSKVKVM